MTYFNHFCIFCSVRLGSIAVGVISFIEMIIPTIYLLILGPNRFCDEIHRIEKYIKDNSLDERFLPNLEHIQQNAEAYFISTATFHGLHLVVCVLEVIGAYILNKWMLLPFIILEFLRLELALANLCFILIVIKKAVNLGLLIGLSVLGSFAILLLMYLWACVLSLFQIIIIVNSPEYQNLYGDNLVDETPKSFITKLALKEKVENVKFFPSPDFRKNAEQAKTMAKLKALKQPQQNEYIEMNRQYGGENVY